MTQEAVQESTASAPATTASRVKSEYRYPVYDLNDSLAVAREIKEQGGGTADDAHLAAYLRYSTARSGTFLARVAAARAFGLITKQGNQHIPTARALAILSPERPGVDDRAARVQAFFTVPLYRTVYNRYKNQSLPPEVGVRAVMETQFGIAKDRTAIAYRVLMDSADQAGFFEARGGQRTHLIEPVGIPTAPTGDESGAPGENGGAGSGDADPAGGGGANVRPVMSAMERLQEALIEKVKEIPADDLDKIREYIKEIKDLEAAAKTT